jgi:hypothetical protein
MIYFDLDGVIRDFEQAIWGDKKLREWDAPCPNGQNVFDYVENNLDVLLTAPPTKYCNVIRKHNPTILSSQPELWRPNTTKWIKKYVPEYKKIIYVSKPEEKLPYFLKTDNWLVDDYPNFKPEVYRKIILIDTSFNQNVDCKIRVKYPIILEAVLKTLGGKNKV